ncbi:hypothetical protein ACBY01_11800 [Sphingomonas sp. ac-8]|uniref:hypothetical protein n=1 Tax=Sphingomonas sp. ac-8 TaxID=3242977 RepID=UPI003A7FFB7D
MKRIARVRAIGASVMMGAPGCSRNEADTFAGVQTDVATLGKFVTLRLVPVWAKWSVTTIGKDERFGTTDTMLWAVVRYSDADVAAVSRALQADAASRPVTMGAPPAWLLADVDLTRFRHGSDYVIEKSVSVGRPFASDLYATGFALMLPDHRVLIRFSSQ